MGSRNGNELAAVRARSGRIDQINEGNTGWELFGHDLTDRLKSNTPVGGTATRNFASTCM